MKRIGTKTPFPPGFRGASLIEYGLLSALIGVAATGAVFEAGGNIADEFSGLTESVADAMEDPDAFVMVFETDNVVLYPMAGGALRIDWGDEAANASCGQDFVAGAAISCAYPGTGSYRVSITGDLTEYGDIAGAATNGAITRIVQWGNTGLTSLNNGFHTATSLVDVPADLPSSVTDLDFAFLRASSLNDPDIGLWDVSGVTTLSHTFGEATIFNVDIGSWDVSNVTSMRALFWAAEDFDQDITDWDVSSVKNLQATFRDTKAFSYDLNSWDVSSVEVFQSTFKGSNYNGDISSWDMSSATHVNLMFEDNKVFDQNITGWDVSSIRDFSGMFARATSFDRPIGTWDMSMAVDLAYMFDGAESFNQDISVWDVSSATNMEEMFENASAFSADLSGWCVPLIASEPLDFSTGSAMSSGPVWGTCP